MSDPCSQAPRRPTLFNPKLAALLLAFCAADIAAAQSIGPSEAPRHPGDRSLGASAADLMSVFGGTVVPHTPDQTPAGTREFRLAHKGKILSLVLAGEDSAKLDLLLI